MIAKIREAFEINKEDHLAPIISYAAAKVGFSTGFCFMASPIVFI